jgi:hypothetical protein
VHLKENNGRHGNIKKVVELILRLPGSNASIETVFSRMNYIWSEKPRLHVDTIQAILAVKTNNDLSLEAFTEKLASNPGVLKKCTLQVNTMPSQGPPLLNNQGTVKTIMSYKFFFNGSSSPFRAQASYLVP